MHNSRYVSYCPCKAIDDDDDDDEDKVSGHETFCSAPLKMFHRSSGFYKLHGQAIHHDTEWWRDQAAPGGRIALKSLPCAHPCRPVSPRPLRHCTSGFHSGHCFTNCTSGFHSRHWFTYCTSGFHSRHWFTYCTSGFHSRLVYLLHVWLPV